MNTNNHNIMQEVVDSRNCLTKHHNANFKGGVDNLVADECRGQDDDKRENNNNIVGGAGGRRGNNNNFHFDNFSSIEKH